MPDRIVNDFSLRISTPNGTGSQSSNLILLHALTHMGLAANAKNLFPSNIAGLPTWYQIRISPEGWQSRSEEWQVLVPLNPATIGEDLAKSAPGTVVIDNSSWKTADSQFEGFIRYPVPFDVLAREISNAKLRPKLKNLIYVGVIAELFGIPEESLEAAIGSIFHSKEKVIALNLDAARIGMKYVREELEKVDPYNLEKADQIGDRILVDGNEAAALGCIYGGVTVVSWYPITPASSLAEFLISRIDPLREKDGDKNRYVVLQAEDELAAVGMALGAGWAGARSMTSTSGPGISLMSENLGFGYYAEIPCVVFDVQRVGPSTGLPTRTQQSDLLQVAFLSQGDTRFPMVIPSDPKEAFEFSWRAFDLADRYQIPLMVMSDLDLAMNLWVCDPLEEPDAPMDWGKLASDEILEKYETWGRYRDLDGDGIPYRTLPGVTTDPRTAHLTRGSGHDQDGNYSEDPVVYSANLDRLTRKIDGMVRDLPEPVIEEHDAALGLIAFGTTDPCVQEVQANLPQRVSYLRIRSFPFHDSVGQFIDRHAKVLVVEQNQQGQMAHLLRMSYPQLAGRIASKTYFGGLPLTAEFVRSALDSVMVEV
ncbi:MAG TPA: 2-oxoacid:acceptor oxidoreductase subunit alpha [Planctomycetes bacterium]|nr:2-oxoacid:acceptor oxidoreductase subunit alpha [Planctomycetota bacterium]HIN81275.1 2-oxoacid:acceptor oxidoreductase subunit alpha [Planctomycetota bacterium]